MYRRMCRCLLIVKYKIIQTFFSDEMDDSYRDGYEEGYMQALKDWRL